MADSFNSVSAVLRAHAILRRRRNRSMSCSGAGSDESDSHAPAGPRLQIGGNSRTKGAPKSC